MADYVSKIPNFSIGPYEFVNGRLTLDDEASAKFDRLLEQFPPVTRDKVVKIDVSKAEEFARKHQQMNNSATKAIDSSVHHDRPVVPPVGTTELGTEANQKEQQKMANPLAAMLDKTK